MCSIHNEGKSVVAERFIWTLKSKIYKHMTSVSKNLYIDTLDNIINEYNTYHRTIKMKPTEVKDNTYINYIKDVNDKDPKFKVGDHMLHIGLKKFFWLKKLKILFHGHMLLMISMAKKLLEQFMKKNYKKQIYKDLW